MPEDVVLELEVQLNEALLFAVFGQIAGVNRDDMQKNLGVSQQPVVGANVKRRIGVLRTHCVDKFAAMQARFPHLPFLNDADCRRPCRRHDPIYSLIENSPVVKERQSVCRRERGRALPGPGPDDEVGKFAARQVTGEENRAARKIIHGELPKPGAPHLRAVAHPWHKHRLPFRHPAHGFKISQQGFVELDVFSVETNAGVLDARSDKDQQRGHSHA